MKFPDKFYWGEKAWEAFARPCQIFLEFAKRNIDKAYNTCKVPTTQL